MYIPVRMSMWFYVYLCMCKNNIFFTYVVQIQPLKLQQQTNEHQQQTSSNPQAIRKLVFDGPRGAQVAISNDSKTASRKK